MQWKSIIGKLRIRCGKLGVKDIEWMNGKDGMKENRSACTDEIDDVSRVNFENFFWQRKSNKTKSFVAHFQV